MQLSPLKMNLTFMRPRNAVISPFLCRRVQCGNTTQLESVFSTHSVHFNPFRDNHVFVFIQEKLVWYVFFCQPVVMCIKGKKKKKKKRICFLSGLLWKAHQSQNYKEKHIISRTQRFYVIFKASFYDMILRKVAKSNIWQRKEHNVPFEDTKNTT